MDDSDSILRKDRRYLLILSLVIIVRNLADITISTNQVNILNNTISFEHPEVIYVLLVLIWGYFFLKFKQRIENKDKQYALPISNKDKSLLSIIAHKAHNWAKSNFIKANPEINADTIKVLTGTTLKPIFGLINIFNLNFIVSRDGNNDETENTEVLGEVKVGIIKATQIYLKSFYEYISGTQKFLNYSLPHVLSAITLIIIFIDFYSYLNLELLKHSKNFFCYLLTMLWYC